MRLKIHVNVLAVEMSTEQSIDLVAVLVRHFVFVMLARKTFRQQNMRYKNPQIVMPHCFVLSSGVMFHIFHLA